MSLRLLVLLGLASACQAPADPLGQRAGALEECPADEVDRGVLPALPPPRALPRRLPPALCGDDGCAYERSDDVYGRSVARASSWWVHDGFIYRGEERVRLRGVSWFGLESKDVTLHGLWTGRSVPSFLDQMIELGFDAIRVPLAPAAYREARVMPTWATDATGVRTARELLEQLLDEADRRAMYILLDVHTCAHGQEPAPGTPWDCEGYTRARWLDDLAALAELAADHPHVVGIDLFNEPYAMLWGEWADAASEAARVVLTANPRILVFVQGAWFQSGGAAYDTIYGEALTHAALYPPDIPASRLVYAPHAYGPDVYRSNYLASAQYPEVLEHVWELRFGHLFTAGHGMAIGEFGGHYDDTIVAGSVDWLDRFVAWLGARGLDSFFFWCWNPNSVDTGGILLDDWETADPAKLRLLAPLLDD